MTIVVDQAIVLPLSSVKGAVLTASEGTVTVLPAMVTTVSALIGTTVRLPSIVTLVRLWSAGMAPVPVHPAATDGHLDVSKAEHKTERASVVVGTAFCGNIDAIGSSTNSVHSPTCFVIVVVDRTFIKYTDKTGFLLMGSSDAL